MKLFKPLAAALLATLAVSLCAQSEEKKDELVFREPFTLKVGIDKKHYTEQKFGKIPYVDEKGNVYLFKGENFGVRFSVSGGEIAKISYEKDPKKADLSFEFAQNDERTDETSMMLIIKNNTDKTVYMNALMTIPGKKGILKTSILPVQPKLEQGNFENWPHPIIQLVLKDITWKKPPEKQAPPPR